MEETVYAFERGRESARARERERVCVLLRNLVQSCLQQRSSSLKWSLALLFRLLNCCAVEEESASVEQIAERT